jgi:hypothetical protein
MAEYALKDYPNLVKPNGNGNNGHGEEAVDLDEWASTTRNPSRALYFYNFYLKELGLPPDQARLSAEDSIRIDREVQTEFAA